MTIRRTGSTDTTVQEGDLDITDSLTIRGVLNQTVVTWHPQIDDKTFELLGDYDGNGVVDDDDHDLWAAGDPSADGNDDGVIDLGDYNVWRDHDGNVLVINFSV